MRSPLIALITLLIFNPARAETVYYCTVNSLAKATPEGLEVHEFDKFVLKVDESGVEIRDQDFYLGNIKIESFNEYADDGYWISADRDEMLSLWDGRLFAYTYTVQTSGSAYAVSANCDKFE